MTATKKPTPFQIIRHRGTPNKAQLPDGRWVYRQEKVWIEEYQGFVPTAPYDDQFIYQMPKDVKGPIYICSCGAAAIIVGLKGYVHDASPQGKLMVCMAHSSSGKHLGGGAKWI